MGMRKSEPKPKNKVMEAKHKKARVEAMKEWGNVNLRGSMADVQRGRLKELPDGIGMYKAHAVFVANGNRCSVQKRERLVVASRKEV